MCYHDEPPYDDLPKAKPPTRIVVAGQTVDVVPWPPFPEMAALDEDVDRVFNIPDHMRVGPAWRERIAAAFGWRW